jgi:hypothetical protein
MKALLNFKGINLKYFPPFLQPMMPYGTPPPYVMYPPGGIYAHPSMPPVHTLMSTVILQYQIQQILISYPCLSFNRAHIHLALMLCLLPMAMLMHL